MSTALTTFTSECAQLRTITIDGQSWFVAKDTANILGYTRTPHTMRLLDADEKAVRVVDTLGRPQRITVITEPGLYKLIQSRRRAEAREFDRWVRHTVLQALRKDGMYVVGRRGPSITALSERAYPSGRPESSVICVRMG